MVTLKILEMTLNNLDSNCILEEMDNEDWEHVVTLLQDEMRHSPADCILFCRDPLDAVHASAVDNKGGENAKCSEVPVTKTCLGVRQYRKNYEEFWYILGDVALSEGGMSSSTVRKSFGIESIENSSDEDSTYNKSKNKKKRKKAKKESFVTTTRLDSDLVRDLLTTDAMFRATRLVDATTHSKNDENLK